MTELNPARSCDQTSGSLILVESKAIVNNGVKYELLRAGWREGLGEYGARQGI